MREIIGYAPIEPDGSVEVQVPANIAFGWRYSMRTAAASSQRHQNWLTVTRG